MTRWFLEHTIEDQGFRLVVEPKIVLEVAFNNMMQSDRHESGYALRFPRILRMRPDKLPEEADTIERAAENLPEAKELTGIPLPRRLTATVMKLADPTALRTRVRFRLHKRQEPGRPGASRHRYSGCCESA